MKKERKNMWIKILIISALFIIGVGGIFGGRIYYLAKDTKGEAIDLNANTNTAILVLDVQNDTWNNTMYKEKEKTLASINTVIKNGIQDGAKIIYIKQEFQDNVLDNIISGGMYKGNSIGSEFANGLYISSEEKVFSKNRNDTFSSKEFEQYLTENNIGNLYIVGADSTACVYKTALGAKQRNYNVTIIENAIYSINDDVHSKMIQKYNNAEINVDRI